MGDKWGFPWRKGERKEINHVLVIIYLRLVQFIHLLHHHLHLLPFIMLHSTRVLAITPTISLVVVLPRHFSGEQVASYLRDPFPAPPTTFLRNWLATSAFLPIGNEMVRRTEWRKSKTAKVKFPIINLTKVFSGKDPEDWKTRVKIVLSCREVSNSIKNCPFNRTELRWS